MAMPVPYSVVAKFVLAYIICLMVTSLLTQSTVPFWVLNVAFVLAAVITEVKYRFVTRPRRTITQALKQIDYD
ncbi:MAG: hypothetical protein KW788_01950 [Candidatus Doudnabacteria bacterium]|nr:hypothetical protein [Candidatus Doudnabacteria bacterium]